MLIFLRVLFVWIILIAIAFVLMVSYGTIVAVLFDLTIDQTLKVIRYTNVLIVVLAFIIWWTKTDINHLK